MRRFLATLVATAAFLVLPASSALADEYDVTVPVKDNCTLTVVHYEHENGEPTNIVDFYVLRYECKP